MSSRMTTTVFLFCFVLIVVHCLTDDSRLVENGVIVERTKYTRLKNGETVVPNGQKSRYLRKVHKRFFKTLQRDASKKNQQITCPELNNFTFTNDPPYDVLGIPECGAQVQPQMVLYFLPLNKSDDKSAVSKKDISIVDEDLSVHSYDFVFKDELDQIHNEALPNQRLTSLENSVYSFDKDEKATGQDVLKDPHFYNTSEETSKPSPDPFFLQCELIPSFIPNNVTESCLSVLNARKDVKKIAILIHGYLNSFPTVWLHEMQASIQTLENDTAVIIFGWGRGLGDIWTFWRAARNSRYAGRALFEVIHYFQKNLNRRLIFHCIGHSLGAHVCGFAGKYLTELKDPAIRRFDRISGMDPAGPLFANDVPFPFNNLNVNPEARLGPEDADYVDIIHTDGNARYLDYIPQYGTLENLGTVDFYPGQGNVYYGCYQPGCGDVIDVISCSHSRAHQLYSTSINMVMCQASRYCDGDPHHFPEGCKFMNSSTNLKPVAMGYWLDPKNLPKGSYTVEVTGYPPFCG